jgi:hypothetical protein
MNNIITFLFLALTPTVFSQDSTQVVSDSIRPITFEELILRNNMSFTAPEGYTEIEPHENRQMNYEKAYKHPTEHFEVRYAVRSHEFNFYVQMFEMTVLNISGGQLPEYTPFGTDAVKKEFGADAGATVFVSTGPEFSNGYKYCLLVYIHKTGVGDGYVFYMTDDNSIVSDLMNPIFHNLRFNED